MIWADRKFYKFSVALGLPGLISKMARSSTRLKPKLSPFDFNFLKSSSISIFYALKAHLINLLSLYTFIPLLISSKNTTKTLKQALFKPFSPIHFHITLCENNFNPKIQLFNSWTIKNQTNKPLNNKTSSFLLLLLNHFFPNKNTYSNDIQPYYCLFFKTIPYQKLI